MNVHLLVDRGLVIRAELKRLTEELEGIEAQLTQIGLKSEHEDLRDQDREGKRWLARGTVKIVPVIFTADKLRQSFQYNSSIHSNVRMIAGDLLSEFYSLERTLENRFKDGKQFRNKANDLLGAKASAFVNACLARDKFGTPKSDIKICWDDAADPLPA